MISDQISSESSGHGRLDSRPSGARYGWTTVYLFLAYGLLSLGMGLVPALVTTFRARYGLTWAQVANINNLKDLGAIAAMLVGPFILSRVGAPRTILLAIGTAFAGCVDFILAHGFVAVCAGAFLHGAAFSFGALATVTHLFSLPERFRRIAGITATFAVANFVAPVLVARCVHGSYQYAVIYLIFAVALGALLLAGSIRHEADGGPGRASRSQERRGPTRAQFVEWLPDIGLYAVLLAGETAVVSWVTSIAQYRYAASLAAGSTLLAALWLLYAPARAAGDLLLRRFPAPRIIMVGACVAATGALLICAGNLVTAYAGTAIFTLGMAPLIPVHQSAVLTRTAPAFHSSMNAALGIAGAAFTTLVVWITGLGSDIDLRLPFLIAAGLLLSAAGGASRRQRTTLPESFQLAGMQEPGVGVIADPRLIHEGKYQKVGT